MLKISNFVLFYLFIQKYIPHNEGNKEIYPQMNSI